MLESLTPLLAGTSQSGRLAELAARVEDFDFDAALDALAQLQTAYPLNQSRQQQPL